MRESKDQWLAIESRLLGLQGVLEKDPEGRRASKLFAEFLSEHEYGLALHVACDVFLQGKSKGLDREALDAIRWLHEKMLIQDDCVELLERGVRSDRGTAD